MEKVIASSILLVENLQIKISKMEMWQKEKSKMKHPSGSGSKMSSPLQAAVLGYFSARSRLNDGVLSAIAIMMWPCRWDGQIQATNFGQTSGQRQTRHTQSERMDGWI